MVSTSLSAALLTARTGQLTDIDEGTMRILFFALLSTLSLACCAEPPPKLPSDVAAYVERRALCDHLRGEIPDAPDDELIRRINEACRGVDSERDRLLLVYREDEAVQEALSALETKLEKP